MRSPDRRSRLPAALGLVALAGLALQVAACLESHGKPWLQPHRERTLDGDALHPRSRGAWKRLREETFFGATWSSWTFGPIGPAVDACTLWSRGERAALVDIATSGTWEGRLWAMCALRGLDPEIFEALAPEFEENDTNVKLVHGCIATTDTVANSFATDVVDDAHLHATLEDLTTAPPLERILAWGRTRRGRHGITSQLAEQAFERLAGCDHIETSGTLDDALSIVLEEEELPVRAALVLLASERAAPRYWGARLLREACPSRYDVLRPTWESERAEVRCLEDGAERIHALVQALAAHVD